GIRRPNVTGVQTSKLRSTLSVQILNSIALSLTKLAIRLFTSCEMRWIMGSKRLKNGAKKESRNKGRSSFKPIIVGIMFLSRSQMTVQVSIGIRCWQKRSRMVSSTKRKGKHEPISKFMNSSWLADFQQPIEYRIFQVAA